MFTGIIQAVAKVSHIQRSGSLTTLGLKSLDLFNKIKVSDSVAVNGVCLTAVKKESGSVFFQVVAPTLKSTNLKRLKIADRVNIETALKVGDPLGGHFVLGHIDKEARLRRVINKGKYFQLSIELPGQYSRYAVEKGSVAVEGISLTIKSILSGSFTVDIIPLTYNHTTLKLKHVGEWLNIEFDYLLKKK